MTKSLRIIVADDEPLLVEGLSVYLEDLGHCVVATAATGSELVERSLEIQPDLVITDIKMPDMDGLEAVKKICNSYRVPVVIVSAYHDEEFIRRASEQCIMSYLVKPIDEQTLKASLSMAMRRFAEFQALMVENENLKQTLENRKIIERAKGILMQRSSLSEQDAFTRLQDLASTKHQKMIEIARMIIEADQAF